MRKSAPPLLAIFRTPLQGDVLARVYLSPSDARVSISDLARDLHRPIPSVHREVTRLVEAGLLTELRSGRNIMVGVPDDSLVTRPMTELLAVTFGPLPVLRDLVADTPGVEAAYIYGSWAARYVGEPGPTPVDVDVVLVGDLPMSAVDGIAEEAERRLRREVNIRRVSTDRWTDPAGNAFLTNIQQRPLVSLIAEEEPA